MDEAMWRRLARQVTGLGEPKEQDDRRFDADLKSVVAFRDKHGRIPSRRAKHADEARLGRWLEGQKNAERHGNLCAVRRGMLVEALGICWTERS